MRTVRPGSYLVNSYPILMYVPYYLSMQRVAPRRAYALPGSGGRCQATNRALIHFTLVRNQQHIFIGQKGNKIFVCQVSFTLGLDDSHRHTYAASVILAITSGKTTR